MALLLYFGIIVFTVFADLFTKFLVKGSDTLMSGGKIEIIEGVFRLRYVENPGAAMGSFTNNRWVFMIFSTVAIVAILVYLVWQHKKIHRLLGTALAMVTGGGIGNMYERLFNQNARGQYVVTDFFDFYLFDFWKWVFNVADAAVCIGAGLMVLYLILDLVREYREKKHPEQYDELVALDAIGEDTADVLELYALDGSVAPMIADPSFDPAEEDSFEGDEVDLDALEELYLDDGEGFEDGEDFDGDDDGDFDGDDDGEENPTA